MSNSTIKHLDVLYGIVGEAGYGYKLADWAINLLRILGKEIRNKAIAAQPGGGKGASPN